MLNPKNNYLYYHFFAEGLFKAMETEAEMLMTAGPPGSHCQQGTQQLLTHLQHLDL